MNPFRGDFAPFADHIWLNAASEGPLPLAAAKALQEAVEWKSLPWLLDNPKFVSVPRNLKEKLGKLLNVEPRDVILGNSASYGLHLLANGIVWKEGDEILLMQNDFPTNILPWLALEEKGVKVKQIRSRSPVLQPEELLKAVHARTRLFCVSHVHTFTGYKLDVEEFAGICRRKNILFVVNVSQSAGNTPLDFSRCEADAVVAAGYKWLCGPYGTGFAWIRPRLREELKLNQAYWIPSLSEEELAQEGALKLKEINTARKYDVFGTANFFNFVPFHAAVAYWLKAGLENVSAYNASLIDQLVKGLDPKQYTWVSPKGGPERSNLAVISSVHPEKNKDFFLRLRQKGIYTAFWKGNIRLAPHVYNTSEEIESVVRVLNELS